jgi:PAS domain S-box-containing protein
MNSQEKYNLVEPAIANNASLCLDLATVLKASHTLSSEIDLDRLLSTLLGMMIENSGANYCVFVLRDSKDWIVKAIAKINSTGEYEFSLTSTALANTQAIPITLINIVKDSRKPATIFDFTSHPVIAADRYVQQHQPKSMFALPILHQGKLIGILYLENTLTTGAFTNDRIQLLNLLCTQAAISIENAQLYQQSHAYSQQLEQSLEKLQLSEARYRYLATATSHIIWLASPEGENLDTVHWRAYTGQSEAEVKGAGWLNALHPDDIEHTTQVWLNAVQTKSSYETEYRIRGADGVYRYFAVQGVPLLGEDGNVQEWIGTCTDIDARKRAEDQVRQKSQELEQTLQHLQTMQIQLVQNEKMSALGNLVAGVAHEINNPVGFLAGNIQPALDYINDLFGLIDLYQQQFPNPGENIEKEIETIELEYLREDLPKLIASMQAGVDRIRNITNSLRTFSRADRDYKVPFNLHEGIDSTLLILKHRLKANDTRPAIVVTTDYGNFPCVECFPGQINQVFMNLLANAIDALEEGNQGKTLSEINAYPNQISIRIIESGNYILVEIQDNGIGMTPEVQQRMFDHLFTTKGVGKGTGLGLAIARQIVEEVHGGKIIVDSLKGQGTKFSVFLPLG